MAAQKGEAGDVLTHKARKRIRSTKKTITYKKDMVLFRSVVNPDPYPDSGLDSMGSLDRIRIQIPDPYTDPGRQKLPTKIEKSWKISFYEVLDVLF